MTAMTRVNGQALAALTVGKVAEQFDVTVRTLHHYDEGRSRDGHRSSTGEGNVWHHTKENWIQIKAETDANNAQFVAAMNDGEPATSERVMAAAEQHRLLIEKWFNPVPYPMHKGMSDLYVTDPRFTKTYEDVAPGLAQFVRDAIHANADLAERQLP